MASKKNETSNEKSILSSYLEDMHRRDSELSKGWGQIATPLYAETKEASKK